jgi:uncharacterized protein YndB with AHSA1/START domain
MPSQTAGMPVFRHQIWIARPIEPVFAAVADASTHPRWQQGLVRSEKSHVRGEGVGAQGFEVRRMLGHEIRFPYEITVYRPPRAWGFRVPHGPLQLAATLSFSHSNEGTLIESELRVPGLLGLLLGRSLLAQQRHNYACLKQLLETGAL